MLLLAAPALALTPPIAGAVALPAGVDLTLPFPDGTDVIATCTYGPGCSSFHSGTDETCCTNDHYALDLVRNQAGNGDGEPVLAVANGTVVYADWATGGWSTFGRMVLVEHDFGDGHTYLALYAHLSDWSVSVGDPVAPKDEIGRMGGSGNRTDGYFASHLHFSLYRDASFLGGPYGGQSTVPEPLDGYEDLVDGMRMTAGPGPGGVATTLIVDDADPGFALTGPAARWTSGGYRDAFRYEPAAGAATTVGTWTPTVGSTGLYVVAAYIPYSDHATSVRAPFTLLAHGDVATDAQDQSIIGGAFHDLFGGRAFKLVAGGSARVELHNGTGEGSADVAWDAIRFTRVGEPGGAAVGDACADSAACADALVCGDGVCRAPCAGDGDCAPGGACEPATGLCDAWPADGTTTPTDPTPTTPGDTGAGTGGDDDATDGPARMPVGGGCGCATPVGPGPGSLLLLAGFAARRRVRGR